MAIDNNDIVICTIATKNYIASARVLADSFLKYHPEGKMYLLLVDKVDGYFTPEREKFEVITVDDLKDDSITRMLFWYGAREASFALKSYLLLYLFSKFGYKKLIFLDSDIMITARLDDIWELLNKYSIIMTPHNTDPISPEWYDIPNETITLMWGVMNIGFIALSNDLNTEAFLKWWW
jgi:alpha-N-acetylglucosamine transferase